MVSGGMTCVKYLLFVFNLLFAISGIAILAVGAIIQGIYYDYTHFLDDRFFSVPVLLIIVGAIVFFVAFFGCCGAVKENHCMLITFAVLLVLIFILELAGGIAGYVLQDEVQDMLVTRMNNTMEFYNNNTEYARTWDVLQHDLHCCGINGPQDWTSFGNDTVPQSCCINDTQICSQHPKGTDIYNKSCLNILVNILTRNALILGGVGIGIALIQLVGVIFACCLAKSVKKEYETV